MTQTINHNAYAWKHGGTAVNATSASEVARQAGLDWTVSLVDMFAERKEKVTPWDTITKRIEVPNKQAVIRHDNNTVVGVVGTKYKAVQNMEVFSAMDSLVDSGDARYTAAGEYNNGSNIWMIMELPNGVNVADDPHAAFLLVKSSHDGSCSVIVKPIIERLFCANQINRLIRGKKMNAYTYTMKHTTNAQLSVNDIRSITNLTYSAIEDYELLAGSMLQVQINTDRVRNIFKRVWALPTEVENVPVDMLSQGQRRQQTIAYTARDKAWEIYSQSPTQENIRGTAFGAWQAVVEYADHHASGGAAKRAVATLSGRSDRIKDKALELILA